METSKLNSKINESKSKIEARKSEIGEYYWRKYENGETLNAEVMEIYAAIKAENEAIEGYNQEITKIKAAPPHAKASVPTADPAETPCTSFSASIPAGKKFQRGRGAVRCRAPRNEIYVAKARAEAMRRNIDKPAGAPPSRGVRRFQRGLQKGAGVLVFARTSIHSNDIHTLSPSHNIKIPKQLIDSIIQKFLFDKTGTSHRLFGDQTLIGS